MANEAKPKKDEGKDAISTFKDTKTLVNDILKNIKLEVKDAAGAFRKGKKGLLMNLKSLDKVVKKCAKKLKKVKVADAALGLGIKKSY
jgi:hypothetical protein